MIVKLAISLSLTLEVVFFMKSASLLFIVCYVFLVGCFFASKERGAKNVGGSCNYKSYAGVAKVVSVKRVVAGQLESEDEYEVKFIFVPTSDIQEPFVLNMIKGPILLLLDDGSLPKKWLLEKYHVEEGSVINCSCMVIESGSCSPILFTFPWSPNNR